MDIDTHTNVSSLDTESRFTMEHQLAWFILVSSLEAMVLYSTEGVLLLLVR